MSTVSQIVNTIGTYGLDEDTEDQILSLFMVEKWRRFPDEHLFFDEITNEERSILRCWCRCNLEQYSHRRQVIPDIRECFPGLSTLAIHELLNEFTYVGLL